MYLLKKKKSFYDLQSIEVTGIVVDVESQTPLMGVNIVSGETGTITDIFGTFREHNQVFLESIRQNPDIFCFF